MRNEWLKHLTVEELPPPYREMAAKIGVENTVVVAEEFGGMTWYFPKLDRTLRVLRNKKLRQEFNGGNYRDLAREYNLTESQIRIIVDLPDNRQMAMEL